MKTIPQLLVSSVLLLNAFATLPIAQANEKANANEISHECGKWLKENLSGATEADLVEFQKACGKHIKVQTNVKICSPNSSNINIAPFTRYEVNDPQKGNQWLLRSEAEKKMVTDFLKPFIKGIKEISINKVLVFEGIMTQKLLAELNIDTAELNIHEALIPIKLWIFSGTKNAQFYSISFDSEVISKLVVQKGHGEITKKHIQLQKNTQHNSKILGAASGHDLAVFDPSYRGTRIGVDHKGAYFIYNLMTGVIYCP